MLIPAILLRLSSVGVAMLGTHANFLAKHVVSYSCQ
jgi:hypothetical protein